MRLLLMGLIAVATFACAWLLLYQVARVLIALVPAAQIPVLIMISLSSFIIAWRVVRETVG